MRRDHKQGEEREVRCLQAITSPPLGTKVSSASSVNHNHDDRDRYHEILSGVETCANVLGKPWKIHHEKHLLWPQEHHKDLLTAVDIVATFDGWRFRKILRLADRLQDPEGGHEISQTQGASAMYGDVSVTTLVTTSHFITDLERSSTRSNPIKCCLRGISSNEGKETLQSGSLDGKYSREGDMRRRLEVSISSIDNECGWARYWRICSTILRV